MRALSLRKVGQQQGNPPELEKIQRSVKLAVYLHNTDTQQHVFSDPGLPNHTFYAPLEITAGLKTPILVWGEGGCFNMGTMMQSFLLQLASQGKINAYL